MASKNTKIPHNNFDRVVWNKKNQYYGIAFNLYFLIQFGTPECKKPKKITFTYMILWFGLDTVKSLAPICSSTTLTIFSDPGFRQTHKAGHRQILCQMYGYKMTAS